MEHPVGSLETAVRGRLTGGRGADGPRIGILAEYDALPGLGHGCGHNTMAASGVGAAIALAAVRDAWAGEVVFLGTPAEERGSGKAIMIREGLFEGLDAALLYHPCDRSHVEIAPLASEDVHITFTGFQAHAASDPWNARNALDAMIALFVSVGLWRQQLPTHTRVHGIIQEGGTAANIVPDRTKAWFMLRSADQAYYETMKRRFIAMCEAAAKRVRRGGRGRVLGRRHDDEPQRRARAALGRERRGRRRHRRGHGPGLGIDGHGQRVVGRAHDPPGPLDHGPATPGHTIEFRDAAARPTADRTTLLAATLVAQTAIDLLCDPALVEAAWAEFKASTAG